MKIDTANVKNYMKKAVQPMFPWTPNVDMEGMSVSDADKAMGCPKNGDMVGYSPDNHDDRWLVNQDYHQDNYTEAPKASVDKELIELFNDTVGKWLSAALDDANVCDLMKADINKFFSHLQAINVSGESND